MLADDRAEESAVQARTRFEQVLQRKLRAHSKLEGNVAELDIEIHETGFAAEGCLALRIGDRQLVREGGGPTPARALDDGHQLRGGRSGRGLLLGSFVRDRRDRGL